MDIRNLTEKTKEKYMLVILAIEAVVCVLFNILHYSTADLFTTMIAFPFEQIGAGLRALSLSGGVGNGIAILFYIFCSLIPAGIWLLLKKRKQAEPVDILLLFLSLLLFGVNYFMVNPGLLGSGTPETAKWSLGSTFYSLFFGYLLIRILLHCQDLNRSDLQKRIRILLAVGNMILVYVIFSRELGDFLAALGKLQGTNSVFDIENTWEISGTLGLTYLFLFLRFLAVSLPYMLDIVIVCFTRRLLKKLEEIPYEEETAVLAEKLGEFCVKSLIITIAVEAVFNLAQLLFQDQLYQLDYVVNIPVFSIVFVFAVLLFARYIRQIQKLKMDNDLFI